MIQVLKADGSKAAFDDEKVRSSLQRAGADQQTITNILTTINPKLYEGISTHEIYSLVYEQLREESRQNLSMRYNLKQAIMDLGPTGYPFEKFFAGILEQYGYSTKTNVMVQGTCVRHEIDILAEKDGTRIMIESKFHNRAGTKSDVRSALYTHARFLDIKEKTGCREHWLVTNTKATYDAVTYGNCVGMKVVSWNKPDDFSVRYLIEKSNLHPLTALPQLSKQEKQRLLNEGVVFVKDYQKSHS